jgi:hypothetical protein
MTRHLIHVGYPKAGSTFLQTWFREHPGFHYAEGGIAGFHDVYQMCRPIPPRRCHVTSCENLSTPHESAGGSFVQGPREAAAPPAPIKRQQAAVCTALSTLHPGSTILIVTRGFRAMAISGYSQYVRSGGTADLAGMCAALAERLAVDEHHYYDFDYLIRLYADAFGKENVIVLPYELLRDDPRRFLRVLEDRLGVEHVDLEIGRLNPSLSPEELYWYPAIARAVVNVAERIAPSRAQRVHRGYTAGQRHMRPLVRILARAMPGRRFSDAGFPESLLKSCEGKATRLRHDPLYAPYAAEYLWD